MLRKDLIWLVRAAHYFPASELNGQERLPGDEDDEDTLQRLVRHLHTLKKKENFHNFQPRPWSKPSSSPLVCFGRSSFGVGFYVMFLLQSLTHRLIENRG
jgi:hypothetical protein